MGVLTDMSHKFSVCGQESPEVGKHTWEIMGTNSIQGITMRMLEQSLLKVIDLSEYQFSTSLQFCSKQIVILNMPYCPMHHLWKGFKISHSYFLRKIPDLSTVPNLEGLLLDHF
ncbi:hypothetical protein FEM48_Zijuj05G0174500 [Ziziphus jujuba var. spinosa]|uniref:Uncharacterized protein n=1 Tax=Ziziphus jujuba var. spinosa TaxID=714518 RepID=A0A978VG56_ZIZJJ|nr:hypothetical protein FEM48_Zijuj05G0174500 [Ziziphus jujuba var. spinosa]